VINMVLRRWVLKSFFIFFIPGFANTAIPLVFLHGGYVESGIGKVLRVLSQWAKNTVLGV
tara:strand:+ start:586 stop:765 length:180 start_codon:yes stop_codon:yes gene_type:complete